MKRMLFLFVLVVFAYSNAAAETGFEVIEKCAKAMKSEKRSNFKTSKKVAKMKMMGQEMTITFYQKGEDKFRFEQKSPMGEQVIIKNGKTCALIKPMVKDLPAEQGQQLLSQMQSQDSDMRQFLKDTSKVKYKLKNGVEKFNGKSCKVVEVDPKELPKGSKEGENQMYIFVDALTNWLVGFKVKSAQGNIEILLSDMKKVKGAIYPALITTKVNGKDMGTLTVTSFEVNLDLDDKLFSKPKSK